MANDLSIAVIVGRLTRDAELKYTNSGQPICHFSIATSARVKKGSDWIDEPSFWEVDLWGKQGESINQYLTKGKQVAVEGSMRQDKWEKDGVKHIKVIINANTVQLLGSGQAQNRTDDTNHGPAPENRTTARQSHPAANPEDNYSDDIPF
jgi:single-strand DNA-binding protein